MPQVIQSSRAAITQQCGRFNEFIFEFIILFSLFLHEEHSKPYLLPTLIFSYLFIALILAFCFFQIGPSVRDAGMKINLLILVRISITVTTIPAFTTAFAKVRYRLIYGMGGTMRFMPISVYYAKLAVLSLYRVFLFIPFTAIVYPIVNSITGHACILN